MGPSHWNHARDVQVAAQASRLAWGNARRVRKQAGCVYGLVLGCAQAVTKAHRHAGLCGVQTPEDVGCMGGGRRSPSRDGTHAGGGNGCVSLYSFH